jgi:hypothetical protein
MSGVSAEAHWDRKRADVLTVPEVTSPFEERL